jgi:serine phosphatase RsbU (regulator of sigma subunit)
MKESWNLTFVKQFKTRFYTLYQEYSLVTQQKAFLLLALLMMMVPLLGFILFTNLYELVHQQPGILPFVIKNAFSFLIVIYSIDQLWKKKYHFIRKLICVVFTLTVIHSFLTPTVSYFESGMNVHREMFYFLIAFLFFFYSRNSVLFLTAIIIIGTQGLYILAKDQFDPLTNYQAFYATTFGNIYLLAVTVILFSLTKITDNSLRVAEKELAKNRELNRNLEQKVQERTEELESKNDMLNDALVSVKESRKKVMDSIEYARRIQNSLLPDPGKLNRLLPDNFIILKQRDIVGGDFVTIEVFDSGIVVAVIDCTGHGVPGALMTMVASSALRRIMLDEEILDPAEILNRLNFYVKTSLNQDSELATSDDGLDASICFIDKKEKTLVFSGARLPLCLIKNERVEMIKGDLQSIGYKSSNLDFSFTKHIVPIDNPTSFYQFTDGIMDQLGGHKRFSFGRKRLGSLLLENHRETFKAQKPLILSAVDDYRGDNEIQDDITLVGFRLGA